MIVARFFLRNKCSVGKYEANAVLACSEEKIGSDRKLR